MSSNNRTTPSVALKRDERSWLEEKAKNEGVSLGRYIRQVALCQRPQAEVPFSQNDSPIKLKNEVSKQQLEDVLDRQLPKIGNNINQLARHVNEQQNIGPKQIQELKQLREAMNQITIAINKALL